MDEHVRELLARGREHYARHEYDRAEELLEQVLAHDDKFADVHDMLGVIAHRGGHYVDAEKHFERALQLNPNYTEAALNLAVTYNDRGKFAEAREIYVKIKDRPTGDTTALDPFARGKIANMHADLAQAYLDANLAREAIVEYEKALLLCPDFADLRTKLATTLRQIGDVRTRPRALRGRHRHPAELRSGAHPARRDAPRARRPQRRRGCVEGGPGRRPGIDAGQDVSALAQDAGGEAVVRTSGGPLGGS